MKKSRSQPTALEVSRAENNYLNRTLQYTTNIHQHGNNHRQVTETRQHSNIYTRTREQSDIGCLFS